MTDHHRSHSERVSAWCNQATKDLNSEQLAILFEQAFKSVYQRARINISGVTLIAVFERAHFNSIEHHPLLSPLAVGTNGIRFDEFHLSVRNLKEAQMIKAFQYILTEFISILCNLTNEVMAPALYSELSKVVYDPKIRVLKRANGEEP